MAKKKTPSGGGPPTRPQVEAAMRSLLSEIGPCTRYVGFAKRLCQERFSGKHLTTVKARVFDILVDALDDEDGDAEFTITQVGPVKFICLV